MDPGQVELQFFINLFCEHVHIHTHAYQYTHVLTQIHAHTRTLTSQSAHKKVRRQFTEVSSLLPSCRS